MMNTIKKTAAISFITAALFTSCSDDESNLTQDVNDPSATVPKGEVSIQASSGLSSSQAKADVGIDQFMINIKKIEFEYAEGQNPQDGGSGDNDSDDDDNDSDENDSNDDDNDSDGEDENQNLTDLPKEIQDYIAAEYPDDPFCKAEKERDDDDPYLYDVELESGLELYFKADLTLYASEQDDDPCGTDEDDNAAGYSSDDEVNLAGPFELDLSEGSKTITNVDIPEGEYEEVEFKMDVSSNSSSDLYQRSILLTGTIDGTPFEFYHSFDEDFEVDYEDAAQNLIIDVDNNNNITFNFGLASVIGKIDFSSATDGNKNGTIEINPADSDGNQQLAHDIKNAIVESTELDDD